MACACQLGPGVQRLKPVITQSVLRTSPASGGLPSIWVQGVSPSLVSTRLAARVSAGMTRRPAIRWLLNHSSGAAVYNARMDTPSAENLAYLLLFW